MFFEYLKYILLKAVCTRKCHFDLLELVSGGGGGKNCRQSLQPIATWLPSSHSARLPTRRRFGGDAWNDPEVGTNQHVAAGLLKSRVAMLVAYELEVRYLEVLKYSQMTGSFEVSVFLYF